MLFLLQNASNSLLILSNVSADTVAGLIDGVKEFEEVNIETSINIPLQDLLYNIDEVLYKEVKDNG